MKLSTKGLTEAMKELEKIEQNTDEIVEKAIEAGINIVTDDLRAEIRALRTRGDDEKAGQLTLPTEANKKSLLDSLGYTPVKLSDQKYDAKAGFSGLDNNKTKAYPAGHPNAVMASAINRGTSFMQGQPFINRAAKKAKKKAIEEMNRVITEEIKKINK